VEKSLFMNSTLSGGRQNTIHLYLLVLTGEGTVQFRSPSPDRRHQKDLGHLGRGQTHTFE